MDFAKNVLSKFALPILINDLLISFAFVCMGEIHTRLMKLCEFLVSLIRSRSLIIMGNANFDITYKQNTQKVRKKFILFRSSDDFIFLSSKL
jgi:hypothetical protein